MNWSLEPRVCIMNIYAIIRYTVASERIYSAPTHNLMNDDENINNPNISIPAMKYLTAVSSPKTLRMFLLSPLATKLPIPASVLPKTCSQMSANY